jgi:hypothetical protein
MINSNVLALWLWEVNLSDRNTAWHAGVGKDFDWP